VDSRESKRTRLICLALAFVTVAVYCRVAGFAFINYDDPDYVTENPMVLGGLSFRSALWAFTHFHASNWHPLTWISHMLDCQLFGLHAGAHHLVNVALHAANAVLLFLLLRRSTGAQWRSAMVAALFALHPLHVESVAWVAERKDVLSTFFGLLALLAYVRYVAESKTQNPKSKIWHISAVACFVLGLLAKPMLVTLPFVLLLLDFWPLRRVENIGPRTFVSAPFGRLMIEKWPWFVFAAGSSAITFFAQKSGGAVLSMKYFPFAWRLENAAIAYFDYILKALWPVHLAVFYPLPHELPVWKWASAAGFLIAVSLAVILKAKRWPFLLVGWLWFLGTLVPVIGIVQVGSQAMADRYGYLPLTGLFIIAVWGGWEWLRQNKAAQIAGATCAVASLVAFAAVTFWQLQYWQNSLALFSHALAVTHDNAPANNNLGTALAALGRDAEALAHYGKAAEIDPENAQYQNNFATALARAGQPDAAVEHYQLAIRDDPGFGKVYSNLGALFFDQHHVAEAITNLDEAIRINPDNSKARNNLGNALAQSGRLDDALGQYSEAARLDPTNGTIRLNLGLTLLRAGRASDATKQFAEAVRLNPTSAEARYEFGRQLFLAGQFQNALEHLEKAVTLKPGSAVAEFYLSAADAEVGRFDQATAIANRALADAQRTGQASLLARIQQALEYYRARRPLIQKGATQN
jgi:tetratricopeptide (TPR) repeat protein